MKYILFLAVPLTCAIAVRGQERKRTLSASRATGRITIDGKLNEPDWQRAEKASGFIQFAPVPGQPSAQNTEVCILYDDEAVYVGAMMYDMHPDSILKQLSSRDDESGNTDEFGVIFDTYNDRQNATEFAVTAAGVQVDGILKFDNGNAAWNAAWNSKVSLNDRGWCVEMKIPYAALRFPKTDTQVWGVNFFRVIRRSRERSYWNTLLPTVPNGLSQSGIVSGINNIVSPFRLSLLPYVSSYIQNYAGANTNTLDGGMDIKYGFNESFTLDMTLVPDFGQTIYDNTVLNLSPIEVRYDDRRYFFTEGLDLFNKNDLFYSRRVGGAPVNFASPAGMYPNDTIISNPAATKLYNATKISGRTPGNLGIGFFNAVAAPAYATVRDSNGAFRQLQTAPLTNYNVIVFDQALKNNSYVSFINTNVNRKNNSYNADVSALLFKFANKSNTYGIDGSCDLSQLYYAAGPNLGYRYYFDVGKFSGNYTWVLRTRNISDNFNPNDLGYLDRKNLSYYITDQYYNTYKPTGLFVSVHNHVGIEYFRVFNPDVFQSFDVNGSHSVTLKNYDTWGVYWTLMPVAAYDYYEPRTAGRFYIYPKNYMAGAYYSSDYRKKFALDVNVSNRLYTSNGRNTFSWYVAPRFRFNDKLSMVYSLSGQYSGNDVGYVDNRNDSIFFGTRNVNTITSTFDAAYIFTSTMSLKLDARHYWSQADYGGRYEFLNSDGTLAANSYNTDHNVNYNSFNVYTSLVWQFRPGSEMSVVYQNSIYTSPANPAIENNYFNDLNNTLSAPQTNSLSVKVIYYLDYVGVRSAFRKNS